MPRRFNRFAGLTRFILPAVGSLLLLSGCGQKGNLYLPNQKKRVPTPPAQPNTEAQPQAMPPSDTQVTPQSQPAPPTEGTQR
jgi:predicted small lipoprotein YifL